MQNESSSGQSVIPSLNEYKLRSGDMLYVQIQTLDDKTFRLFNTQWLNTSQKNDVTLFIESYIINNDGYVKLPVIEDVKIAGLTLEEAQKEIQKEIDGYLMEASVILKLLNYKITVLGEVNRPGTFKIYDSHVNLLEVISMAGDLTVFGNRQNIIVLRKSENNKMGRLDITNINVINSEFYYLKPYDVIYIEPLKAKSLGFREFPFSILFSSITTVVVLINFLSK